MFGISLAEPSTSNVTFIPKVVALIATQPGPVLGDILFQVSALLSIIISSTCLGQFTSAYFLAPFRIPFQRCR